MAITTPKAPTYKELITGLSFTCIGIGFLLNSVVMRLLGKTDGSLIFPALLLVLSVALALQITKRIK